MFVGALLLMNPGVAKRDRKIICFAAREGWREASIITERVV